jgi:hydrogenase maturation protease
MALVTDLPQAGTQSSSQASIQAKPDLSILVLGLGNLLLTDEGTGIHVIRHLEQTARGLPMVEFMDGGTLSFTLAGPIAEADALIVVDTAALGSAPGSIEVFEGDAMDAFVSTGGKTSVHEVSLSDLLAISVLEGMLPERRALVGIQPQNFDWGDWPTEAVAAAIPRASEIVLDLIRSWRA